MKGVIAHKGSNGQRHRWRGTQYGSFKGVSGENLGFGQHLTPRDQLINFIVDDGVRNRSHRKAIFNKNWKQSGVAVCPFGNVDQYKMLAIVYAVDFKLSPQGQQELQRRKTTPRRRQGQRPSFRPRTQVVKKKKRSWWSRNLWSRN